MQLHEKKSNIHKLLASSLCILLACIFFLGIFAPTLLSTDFGQKIFARILSSQFSGKFTIEHLSLSWSNDQTIKGIEWSNPKEGLFLRCDQITTTSALWDLFLNHNLGEMKMSAPHIELEADLSPPIPLSLQHTEIEHMFSQAGFFPKFSHKTQKFFGNIEVDQGTLLIFSKKKNLASFQQVSAQIYLPEQHFPIELALIGQTEQEGVTGKFDIKALLGSTDFSHPNLDIQAKLVHFPISGIDELFSFFDASLKGFFVEAIGPSFDLDLDAKFVPESQELHLLAQSSLINAELHAGSQNAILTLQNPGKITFTMTPSFAERLFAQFSSLKGLSLKNSPELVFELSKLSLPFGFHFSDAALESEVKISPAELISKQTNEPLLLESFSISLSADQLKKGIKFGSNGSLKMGNLNSAVVLKGDFKDPFSPDIEGNCKLHVQEFPVRLLELLTGKDHQLIPVLGSSLRGMFTVDKHLNFADVNFKASTPLLKISEAHFRIDDSISLLQPIKAVYYPSHNIPLLAPMELSIEKCIIPRSSWEKIELNGHFQIPKIQAYKRWILEELSGEIAVHSLDDVQLQIASKDLQLQTGFAFARDTGTFSIIKPITIDYLLSPAKFHTFFQGDAKAPLLLIPANFHLTVEPFILSSKNLKTKVTCAIDHLSLQIEDKTRSLQNIQFQLALDAPKETMETRIKANGKTLEMEATAKSVKFGKQLDFSKAHLNLALNMEDFPLAIIDSLIEKSLPLAPLLGPALNLSLQATATPDTETLSINATSSQLNLDTALSIKDNLLEIQKNTKFDFLLNEKAYEILDQLLTGQPETPFELEKPSHFHLSLTNLLCPITRKDRFSAPKFDLFKTYLAAHIMNDQCGFTQKQTGDSFSFDKLSFKIDRPGPDNRISFDLTTSVLSKEISAAKEGKIAIEGTIKDPIQIDQLTAQIQAKIQKVPCPLLDIFSRSFGRSDSPFSTFFGNTVNAELISELKNFTGPITATVHSPNTRFSFSGKFDDGALTLKERLYAQIMVTPKLSELFLREVNPFSITSIESLHPMTLEIEPKGFSLPLSNLNWQKLTIPHIRLELGQIHCKNEGNLSLTLGLLKQNIPQTAELDLWFSPIDLHVDHNHCLIDRTEILINRNFEICTFGEIDLEKEKLNMILGLTSQCLNKAFSINNLPPNYLLQIPLKGTMDNVKLDIKKATSKITALLLWKKSALAAGSIGKGSTGALLQDLIGKLATLPDKDKHSPSPKHPFPWEKESKMTKTDEPKIGKKCKIRKKEKPLKQLFKILT